MLASYAKHERSFKIKEAISINSLFAPFIQMKPSCWAPFK